MTNEQANDAVAVELRVRVLERRIRALAVVLGVVVVGFTSAFLYEVRLNGRVLMTSSLFARQVNVPWPQDWVGATRVNAGIATSRDGNEVSLWLAGSPLSGSLQQTRIEASASGRQRLDMYDRKGRIRLRLTTTDEGEPSMTMYTPDGKTLWSAPSAGAPGDSGSATATTDVAR